MSTTKLHTATVTIAYVHETVTKGGLRRFEIGASRVGTTDADPLIERHLSFATLNQFKAALCQQALDQHFPLFVKYQLTPFFDAALLHVERAKDQVQV